MPRSLPSEGEEAASEGGRARRRLADGREVRELIGDGFAEMIRALDDHGEQIVEVVSDAPGQATQALHLLRVEELELERTLLGQVRDDAEDDRSALEGGSHLRRLHDSPLASSVRDLDLG